MSGSFYSTRISRYRPLDGEVDQEDPLYEEDIRRQGGPGRSFLGRFRGALRTRSNNPGQPQQTSSQEIGRVTSLELQEVNLDEDNEGKLNPPPPAIRRPDPAPGAEPGEQDEDESATDTTLNEERRPLAPESTLPNRLHIHVSGKPANVPTPCDFRWTVGETKKQLFSEQHGTKRIRFISRGKLLDDDDATLGDFVEEAGHIHVSITDLRRPGEGDESGAIEGQGELNDENQLLEDLRLARMLQFGTAEEWDGAPEDLQRTREGTTAEFILFFVASSLLGFIMLIFLFQARLTRKKRMGILVGIAVHVLYNISGDEIGRVVGV